ncbi:MAG: Holliday junction resolvase RuvX [Candidatus Microgenomates bacterium]|jgi:putative Holliday junction resolvase
MKILGIDYGRNKMGLAVSDGPLAEPLRVIRYSDTRVVAEQIKKIIEEEKIKKVIVGISEGEMGKESQNFSKNFSEMIKIPVETSDETLSTQEAQILSREAGIHQKKRHEMEDAYAACIMLQNYLDFSS